MALYSHRMTVIIWLITVKMGFTKIYQYGDVIETYQYERDLMVYTGEKKVRKRSVSRLDNKERRVDNIRRLRKAFIRLVSSNTGGGGSSIFCTTTHREIVVLLTF